MSTTSLDKSCRSGLREASAIGDLDEVQSLVESGVNCLHWACKRNHKHIVSYLLSSGADMEILTAKDELAAQLTSKPEIKRLLGVKEAELPIIPNYLSNPALHVQARWDGRQNPAAGDHEQEEDPASSSSLSPTHQPPLPLLSPMSDTPNAHVVPSPAISGPLSQPGPTTTTGALVPVAEQNGVSSPGIHNNNSHHHQHHRQQQHSGVNGVLPVDLSVEPHLANHHAEYPPHAVLNGAPPRASPSPGVGSSGSQVQAPVAGARPAMTRQPSLPQPINCGQTGPGGGSMPAFQPFFFTSTFPMNVQELVLKVRIQNPNARENDFIEVELDRQELTLRALLRVCCRELDVSAEHDKDVARLQDFQELEVVLEKAEGLSLFSGAGALTDRPCYNMTASRLTY
ncbi:hypothetical protein CRUP_000432 [Coryphaenoides rupestris]|nr:hypothetical protein CRUP_000432 [Coryphaenoides rupestris]